jgi:hypothetical protein
MTKLVTRTVKTYTIHADTVKMAEGKIVTESVKPVIVKDITVDDDNALKFVQKEHGKKAQYVVTKIDIDETTYAVPFDVFMQYATVLEK